MTADLVRQEQEITSAPHAMSLMPLGYGIVFLILSLWLLIKTQLFFQLEYTMDFVVHLQKSTSFLLGYPLLSDHIHGTAAYHNTFIELLFAPFSLVGGAHGLFFASALIYGWAMCSAWQLAHTMSPVNRKCYAGFLFSSALGPIAFWIYDNPVYGWHPEPTIIPLALLFTTALVRKRENMIVFFGLLTALVHEGAPIVLFAIHVMHRLLNQDTGRGPLRILVSIADLILIYVSLFILGLLLQRGLDPVGGERLLSVMAIFKNPSAMLFSDFGYILLMTFFLLVVSGLGFIPLFFSGRGDIKYFTILVFLLVPSAVTAYLSGLPYKFPTSGEFHNGLWVPRYCFNWSIVLCSGVLLANARNLAVSYLRDWSVFIALLYLCLQASVLLAVRDYSIVARTSDAIHSTGNHKLLSKGERRVLACLPSALPHNAPIMVSPFLWAPFHRHQLQAAKGTKLTWRLPQFGLYLVKKLPRYIFVFPNMRGFGNVLASVPRLRVFRVKSFLFFVHPRFVRGVRGCLRRY
jgi:hypothetical protein